MPKTWKEVFSSEDFGKLTPEQKDKVKQQYFNGLIAPHVPDAEREKAWGRFSAELNEVAAAPAVTDSVNMDDEKGKDEMPASLPDTETDSSAPADTVQTDADKDADVGEPQITSEQKLQSFELLMGEVSGALADVVTALQARSEDSALNDISSSLADLVATLEKRSAQPMGELVAAIKALRIEAPAVNVTVSPTPIQNVIQPAPVKVEIMPADNKGATWEVTVPGRYGTPDRVMTIRRTK